MCGATFVERWLYPPVDVVYITPSLHIPIRLSMQHMLVHMPGTHASYTSLHTDLKGGGSSYAATNICAKDTWQKTYYPATIHIYLHMYRNTCLYMHVCDTCPWTHVYTQVCMHVYAQMSTHKSKLMTMPQVYTHMSIRSMFMHTCLYTVSIHSSLYTQV